MFYYDTFPRISGLQQGRYPNHYTANSKHLMARMPWQVKLCKYKMFGLVPQQRLYSRERELHRNQMNLETISASFLPLIDTIIITLFYHCFTSYNSMQFIIQVSDPAQEATSTLYQEENAMTSVVSFLEKVHVTSIMSESLADCGGKLVILSNSN